MSEVLKPVCDICDKAAMWRGRYRRFPEYRDALACDEHKLDPWVWDVERIEEATERARDGLTFEYRELDQR